MNRLILMEALDSALEGLVDVKEAVTVLFSGSAVPYDTLKSSQSVSSLFGLFRESSSNDD